MTAIKNPAPATPAEISSCLDSMFVAYKAMCVVANGKQCQMLRKDFRDDWMGIEDMRNMMKDTSHLIQCHLITLLERTEKPKPVTGGYEVKPLWVDEALKSKVEGFKRLYEACEKLRQCAVVHWHDEIPKMLIRSILETTHSHIETELCTGRNLNREDLWKVYNSAYDVSGAPPEHKRPFDEFISARVGLCELGNSTMRMLLLAIKNIS
jgi:hypothetical protein